MAGVYVYDYSDVDLDTTGRVGDLQPVECHFDEKKNGESVLTLRLIYDELNKWAAVKVGSYIRAMVPVRVPPKITGHAYDREIMTWRVKSAVTEKATVWESCGEPDVSDFYPEQKGLFYAVAVQGTGTKKKRVKVKFHAPAGTEVQLLEERDDGRVKIYAKGRGTGWTFKENLERVVATTIPDTFDGVESAVTPSRLEYQLFQVTQIEQTLEYVDITAQHVFYELLHSYTNYKTEDPIEAFAAIEGVFGGMVTVDERFTCLTDSAEKAGALDFERKNVVQALLDPEEGLCAQYGLSLIRDNYDLYALKNVGSDRGFVVEYSKNMLSVERVEDITDVVTRIIPYGRTKKGNPVFLDGTIWVDSPRIDEYAFPRTMYLNCSDTATESDTMSLAQVKENLRERAQAEFDAGCDLPALSMTVDFLSLGDTEEYRQYRGLDKVYLFDRITVRDRVRGYDYTAEVVAIRHNVLTGLLESVTLGSLQKGTGKRKIATWQVPEVDGSNIRLASIAAGVLAGGAVGEENIQTGAVSTRVIDAYAITAEKIAAGAVTADAIEAGSITTDKLAAKSVTADKLDAEFIISDFIEAGSITTEMLAAGAVTADKLAAGAISSDFIEAGSITADKMAAGTITAESGIIAAGAVGTAQIADGSITEAKIVSLNADVITSGTLATDRLLLTGENGVIYEINAESSGLTAAELTDEQYKNQINGTVIVAESITAAQLAAESVTANKILSGAVTADKIAANAVTANAIAAGAITTQKISSDFGSSLDLSSNSSINQIVSGLTQTYVQFRQPVGVFNVGDVWVKTQASVLWSELKGMTWEAVQAKLWGEWAMSDQPTTYVWNGSQWVLTVDYNVVQDNKTSITQTQTAITMKADKTTVDSLSGRVTQNSTAIRQTAEEISLKANQSELDALTGVVDKHGTQIAQNADEIALKANQTDVDSLGKTVSSHTTAIEQNAQEIALKANKTDPAGSVSTSTVTVNASGVNIATGGTFTVDSGNFDLDGNGNMSAQNAYLSGDVYVNGSPALSQKNIYVGTNAPASPISGMVWIKPDTSTSAQTTFTKQITWGERLNLVNNKKSGSLTGTATAAVGTVYTYRIRVPVYISPYSGGTTGAVLHFDVSTTSGGTAALSATKNVTITDYGSGNKVIEMEVTGASWIGNQSTLYFSLYATALSGYYAYNVLNSSDTSASIVLECISTSSSGASGWRDCSVYCYA